MIDLGLFGLACVVLAWVLALLGGAMLGVLGWPPASGIQCRKSTGLYPSRAESRPPCRPVR